MKQNLKIKINSEQESKEAQELFFKIGYTWADGCSTVKDIKDWTWIHAWTDGCITGGAQDTIDNYKFKEITLEQLRTMAGEPKQREYLNRTYNLVVLPEGAVANGLIEVPEGADTLIMFSGNEGYFWKHADDSNYFKGYGTNHTIYPNWEEIDKTCDFYIGEFENHKPFIVWRREQPLLGEAPVMMSKPHQHYFKDVSDVDEIDVYEVLLRFGVTDPCLQHIVKKALCAGERGHKNFHKDLQDIADTAQRMLTIHGV